ncbi:MAG: M20/M25/M40 family metallo-hydrolase [Acidobacteriota bacterium]|nr:M20/M25/M40 family metallo-hydrolase [Acidobacteriota bacterium]
MKKNLLALFLLLTFAFQSATLAQTATKPNSPARKAAEKITAEQLKDYLYFVASDEMEGRDTPSRGLDLTAKFIALNLKRWGFKPAGDDGSFLQTMALSRDAIDAEKNTLEIGGQKFAFGEDFLRVGGNAAVNAPLVFARDGWFVKSKNIDALEGVDAKGKILLLYSEGFNRNTLTPFPKGILPLDLAGEKGKDWADPMTYAKQKGAVGIILVASPQVQKNWEQAKNLLSRGRFHPEKLRQSDLNSVLPTMLVSDKTGEAIFTGEAMSMSSASAFEIKKSASINAAGKKEFVNTYNVAAIWEGSDTNLKNEMVAVGAHYDHVGTNPNAKGEDKIWNGADDDGSGTVAVLSIAEALAKSPKRPKRSVLLVWHAGEEKGLWGSEYFNKFPTVDIKLVVAQLNIDMIGRSRKAGDTNSKNANLSTETEVYVIGSQMMSSELGAVTKSINDSFLNLTYNYKYDDPKDPNRFFFRSDHFNYAVNGIPIVFWFDGVHEDYHQPGDEPEKIDYAKMERISRTIFLTMWELADLKERPKVDKQLPPELTVR